MDWDVLWGRPDKNTPIDVHEVPIVIDDLSAGLEGLRIAAISDLHFGRYVFDEFAARVVELTNRARPDIICILGDMVNNRPMQYAKCANFLCDLRAPLGIFGCLGNHDHYAGPRTAVREFGRAGIEILRNQSRRIAVDGAELTIAGLDDLECGLPDPAAALAGADADTPTVCMSHNPDMAEHLPDRRVDLLLCGHTHGGQIVYNGRPVITRIQNRQYASGLARGPRCWVYTTRGVGVVGLPLRINCRPEIPIIRLTRQDTAN